MRGNMRAATCRGKFSGQAPVLFGDGRKHPRRHFVRQSVGDTCGPGGISRSLRNIPVLVDIARDMEALCPDAWLLNLTNPMTCLTRAINKETSVKAVGLCHEVVIMSWLVAIALGVPADQLDFSITGVNHLPWITEMRCGYT